MKVSEPIIQITQHYEQPIKSVWNALTDVHVMRQWFFDNIPEFEPTVGFKTRFSVTSEDRIFLHLWEITEVIPYHKIVLNWKYDGYQGDSFVTFELSKVNNHTQLTLITKVIEDFPDNIPEFKRESCIAGWNYFIKTSLMNYFKQ